MTKGIEVTAKMRLKPNLQSIDMDYILGALLKLSNKIEGTDLVGPAKEILHRASKRGEEGLYSKDWLKIHKELEITQAQYFYILKILKNAGLLYKSKGRFYVSRVFYTHIANVAKTINNYMLDLGVV